jgi:site-specific DNA recombinase
MSSQNNDQKPTKAYLIARVSDPSQREALPAQELRLKQYAEKHNLDSELFSFDETAYKEDRVKFVKIVSRVVSHPEPFIMVFDKIDRLTRDCSSDIVRTLKNLVKEGRAELHFPSDGLIYKKDSPAHDKTRLDMGMVFSGYYAMAISDNVKRRIEQKLHDGEYPGKACIGYTNIKLDIINPLTKKPFKDIVPDPERSPYIIRAFELRLAGNSYRTIAKILKEEGLRSNTKQLKPIGQSQVEQILKNPFYHGTMRYDGGYYKHRYEPIIEKTLFDLVQRVNEDRSSDVSKTNTKHKFTFNNLLKCRLCGCSISSYTQKGHVYMQCSKAKGPCNQPHTSEAVLLPQINQLLDNLQLIEPVVDQVLDTLKKDHDNMQAFYINSIKQTRNDYTKLEKRLSLLYEDRLDGRITVDEYDTIVSKTKAEMEKLDQRMVQLTNNDKSFIVTSSYLLKLASRAGKLFKSSKPELKSKILYLVLSNLELDDKKLYFNPLPPFDRLLAFSESSTWLRRLGSNQRPCR